jgi:hypothetical protein
MQVFEDRGNAVPRYLLAEISSARIISVSSATSASGRMRQSTSTMRGTSDGGGSLPSPKRSSSRTTMPTIRSDTAWK